MLSSKILLVLLLAVLGTSWVPDDRTNGLVSACSPSVKRPDQCEENKDLTGATKRSTTNVPTIDDIPQEDDVPERDDEFAPLTITLWVANKQYRLPNAQFYKIEMKEGTAGSITHIANAYYKGPVIIKR